MPYGAEPAMARVRDRLRALFGWPEAEVLLVATGTGANALALAGMVEPWQAVLCHRLAHVEADECGAPEFYTGGAKLVLVDGPDGRMTPDSARGGRRAAGPPRRARGAARRGVDHQRDRGGHGPFARRPRRAPRGRARARALGASRRRALRQCLRGARLLGGRDGRGLRRGQLRRHQERLHGGRGHRAARPRAALGDAAPAQTRRAALVQAPVPVGADGGLSRRATSGSTTRAPRTPPARASPPGFAGWARSWNGSRRRT